MGLKSLITMGVLAGSTFLSTQKAVAQTPGADGFSTLNKWGNHTGWGNNIRSLETGSDPVLDKHLMPNRDDWQFQWVAFKEKTAKSASQYKFRFYSSGDHHKSYYEVVYADVNNDGQIFSGEDSLVSQDLVISLPAHMSDNSVANKSFEMIYRADHPNQMSVMEVYSDNSQNIFDVDKNGNFPVGKYLNLTAHDSTGNNFGGKDPMRKRMADEITFAGRHWDYAAQGVVRRGEAFANKVWGGPNVPASSLPQTEAPQDTVKRQPMQDDIYYTPPANQPKLKK